LATQNTKAGLKAGLFLVCVQQCHHRFRPAKWSAMTNGG
jgi:hypothetical protein